MSTFYRFAFLALALQGCAAAAEVSSPSLTSFAIARAPEATPHHCRHAASARAIVGDARIEVDTIDQQLAWTEPLSRDAHPLWNLPGRGWVSGLSAVSLRTGTTVIAFRQEGTIWVGALTSSREPLGRLVPLPSLVPALGAPALVASDGAAMIAWQEGATIRWVRFSPGAPIDAPESLASLPDDAIAVWPSLTALDGGDVLLTWTQFADEDRQELAQSLDARGHARAVHTPAIAPAIERGASSLGGKALACAR